MLKQRGCKRDQAVRSGRTASQYKGHEAGVHLMIVKDMAGVEQRSNQKRSV